MNKYSKSCVLAIIFPSLIFSHVVLGNGFHKAISEKDAKTFIAIIMDAKTSKVNAADVVRYGGPAKSFIARGMSPLAYACSQLKQNDPVTKSMVEILATHYLLVPSQNADAKIAGCKTREFVKTIEAAVGKYDVDPQNALLASDGVSPPMTDEFSNLLQAIENYDLNDAKALIKRERSLVEMRDHEKGTALDVALTLRRLPFIRYLLKHGARISKPIDTLSSRLLHLARLDERLFEQAHLSIVLAEIVDKTKMEGDRQTFLRSDSTEIRAFEIFIEQSPSFRALVRDLHRASRSIKGGCNDDNLRKGDYQDCENSILTALGKIEQAFRKTSSALNPNKRLWATIDLMIKKRFNDEDARYANAMFLNLIFLRIITPIFVQGFELDIERVKMSKHMQKLINCNIVEELTSSGKRTPRGEALNPLQDQTPFVLRFSDDFLIKANRRLENIYKACTDLEYGDIF